MFYEDPGIWYYLKIALDLCNVLISGWAYDQRLHLCVFCVSESQFHGDDYSDHTDDLSFYETRPLHCICICIYDNISVQFTAMIAIYSGILNHVLSCFMPWCV